MDRFIPFTRQASKDDLTNKIAFYKHKNGLLLSGKISSILPPGTPPEIPDAIGTFTNIRLMDISQNNLHALTPRIAQLQGNLYELNASHNLLTDVSEVALLTNLHTLDLSYNNLKPMHIAPLSTLVNLKDFNLSNNSLSSDDSILSSDSPLLDNTSSIANENQTLSPMKVPSLQPRSSSPTPKRRISNPPTPRSPLSQSSTSENDTLDNSNNNNNNNNNDNSDNSDDNNNNLSSISENDITDDSPLTEPNEPLTNESFNEPLTNESFSNQTNDNQTNDITIPVILTSNSSTSNTISRSRSPSPSLPSTASSTTPGQSPSHSPVPFATSTPLSLSHFIHLESLNLSSNNLRIFPDVLTILSLVKLDLSNNKLVEIPSTINTQLVNLKELNLQSNLLEKLPPMMKSLKKLVVDKNPLHPAFLYIAQTGDLLHQLQNQDNVGFPRSSSDSALGLQVSNPTPTRSSTPPPNGFLSRIFRKDHSADTTDSHETRAKDTLMPTPTQQETQHRETHHGPSHSRARSDAGTPAHLQAQADALSLSLLKDSADTTPDTPTKKRAFSLPQSPIPPVSLFRPAKSDIPSEVAAVRDLASPPTPLIFPASPPLSGPTPNELYQDFVKKLSQTPNIKSSIDSFVTRIRARAGEMEAEDLQSALRDFVHNTHTTLAAHPVWRKANAPDLHEAELHLQEYVLEHLYDHIFAARKEDREKDKHISEHIKKCYFITPEHLDIPVLREHEDIWRKAEQQLLQINATRSVRSKMRCVVRMSRDMLHSLAKAHGDAQTGADVLLPHLIRVVLHANPPHLHSNIVYMTRFSESEASETIYYVTQLVAALYFIEHVEASSLNIDAEEFERHMGKSSRPVTAPAHGLSRLSLSGSSAFVHLDAVALSKALDSKRKDFALLDSSESAKWISDHEALLSQCVGLTKEVLPVVPTSTLLTPSSALIPSSSSISSIPSITPSPSIPSSSIPSSSSISSVLHPAPRFEGMKLEDLRAVDIPSLLEDYHRLISLIHSSSSLSFASSPSSSQPVSLSPYPTLSSLHSQSSNSISSMTSSAPPSPLISSSSSPSHSPSSLITFASPEKF